jgi:glyceraldehyde-3-phosphate dehydrogenase (NADP+)
MIEPIHQTEYLIAGQLHTWRGEMQNVYSPILDKDGKMTFLGSYPKLTKAAALKAIDAAVRAYDKGEGYWPMLAMKERIQRVQEFTSKMIGQRAKIVELLMWEIGKSYADSCKEFDRTIEYIEETIKAVEEMERASQTIHLEGGVAARILRAPLGVTLVMGPYNYPLNEAITILLPSILMGNVAVFKPPKLGVLLYQPLLEAFMSLPAGVVNTVYGDGPTVAGSIMESGKVDVLAFIGSSKVGDILKRQHPQPHKLRCVLGMEAKNVGIITESADLTTATSECLAGALSYNGQRCTALKILFVHRNVYTEFVNRFSNAVDELKVGMPWEDGVQITPLPEPGKVDYLKTLVDEANSKAPL